MSDKVDQIGLLARLIEDANMQIAAGTKDGTTPFGRCEWTDIDGNPRCNSPWSQFQCEQAAGTFTPGDSCPPEEDLH